MFRFYVSFQMALSSYTTNDLSLEIEQVHAPDQDLSPILRHRNSSNIHHIYVEAYSAIDRNRVFLSVTPPPPIEGHHYVRRLLFSRSKRLPFSWIYGDGDGDPGENIDRTEPLLDAISADKADPTSTPCAQKTPVRTLKRVVHFWTWLRAFRSRKR